MRKNLLSFSMALAVVGAVFVAYSAVFNSENHGLAVAAGPASGWNGAGDAADRATLLKSIGYSPDNLLKVTGQDVRLVLAEPELVRRDMPTVIWQYRNASCVLDIYFSAKGKDKDAMFAPVVHYEVRARGRDVSDEAVQGTCVRDLVGANNRPRMVDVSKIYKSG